MKLDAAKPESN